MPGPVVPTSLGATPAASNAASAVTTSASITPTVIPKSCLLVATYSRHATVAFTDTTAVAGNSLTWTKTANVQANGGLEQLTVFEGVGTPTSGTLTITLSQTPASGMYHIVQVQDANSATPVVQAVTGNGTATSGSVTLATITNPALLLSFWGHVVNEAVTPDSSPSNWVELGDAGTTLARLETQYVVGNYDVTPTASWATSSTWAGIGLEMKVSVFDADDRGFGTYTGTAMVAHTRDDVRHQVGGTCDLPPGSDGATWSWTG